MTWLGTVLLLLVGLVLIVKGGDVFVDAATWLAERTGIPKLIIGATVVSIATTLPEMLVSFLAAGEGKVDMAIGNAVGSVTVNTGLIMGIALICIPCAIRRKDYMVKSLLMLVAAAVLVVFGLGGTIGWVPSVLLIAIFVLAMAESLREAKAGMAHKEHGKARSQGPVGQPAFITQQTPGGQVPFAATESTVVVGKGMGNPLALSIFKFGIGAVCLAVGSQLLVDNGSTLAGLMGVPERIIAISIVAIGTSLPELVTTLTAIRKSQSALSIGNILGANIIDLTLILPVSSLLAGKAMPVSTQFATLDLPACLLVGLLAIVPALVAKRFARWQGGCMVVFYLIYLGYSAMLAG